MIVRNHHQFPLFGSAPTRSNVLI